ncbi:MAG: DUF2520 domain-containing protein [Chloroflexi bacterium]|nr:DUF2520 domain-containing protein [Chloroflexota bacterium]
MSAAHAIGFIGAGRVGMALAVGLAKAGYQVAAVASRTYPAAQALAAHVGAQGLAPLPCKAEREPSEVVAACDIVFLTVPDDAIAEAAAALPWRTGQAAVHCSGALSSEALEGARQQGATVGCFHPLQTFATREGGEGKLAGSAFAVEGEGWLREWLEKAARKLGGFSVYIKAEDRALYHASAVMACGYVTTMVDAATGLWEALGMTREDGLRALLPLARGTVDTIAERGPRLGATGPIIRGDAGTVERHLEALAERATEALALYQQVGLAMVTLAEARGSITTDQGRELKGLLKAGESVDCHLPPQGMKDQAASEHTLRGKGAATG